MIKRILAVGDLHVGSLISIMPKEVNESINGRNHVHYANEIQLELLKGWKSMLRKVGKVDAVFNMGDNIDGPNYYDKGKGAWTNSLVTQCEAAFKLLADIKAKKHYMVIGSKYHVGGNLNAEDFIANMLRMDGNKVSLGKDLIVKVNKDVGFHLLHEVGYTKNVATRVNALYKELNRLIQFSNEYYGVNNIIRGHAHYFVEVSNTVGSGCITPSWKLQDDFMKKGGVGSLDVGYVLIEINNNKISYHYDGVRFKSNTEVCQM